MYFVYLLECADSSIYTGIATDIERRFLEHKNGTGAAYTRSHKPIRILYAEPVADRSTALKREAQIKRLSRKAKMELAAS